MPGRVVETFQGGLESIQVRGESLCTSSFSCSTEFDLGKTNMFMGVTIEEICVPPPISCIFPITLLTQQAYFIFQLFVCVAK